MELGLFNITSATTTTLVSKNSAFGAETINITNTQANNAVFVSLYLDDGTNQTYYFKKDVIYPGERIFIGEGLEFNNANLGLKLTTEALVPGQSVSVNVIIT